MKKLIGILVVVGLFALATAAWAGLPSVNVTKSSTVNSAINKGVDTAKNKAIADSINKKIQAYNCSAFKNNTTTTELICSPDKLKSLFNEINKEKAPFEALGLASVSVSIKAGGSDKTAYDRARYIEDVAESSLSTSWWKISSRGLTDNTNSLSISVSAE